jgi:hypothetical protein
LLCCTTEDDAAGLTQGNTAELQQNLIADGDLPTTKILTGI